MTPVTPGDRIHELRTRAAELRREADRLDAQAITIAATEYARVVRELHLDKMFLRQKPDRREQELAAATTELARGKALLAPLVCRELVKEWIEPDDPYEYRTTKGQRKAWDGEPDLRKEGWEPDPNRGRPGESWERFDYHEEMYWRRLKKPKSDEPTVPEVSQTQKAPNGASATTETTSL